MERHWNWALRVAGGLAFLAVAVVTALSLAATPAGFLDCSGGWLVLCTMPIPESDWTPVVALAAIGVVLLWPRPRHRREAGPSD